MSQVIMRKVIVCVGLLVCALTAFAVEARAQTVPPIPNAPAATLLLPYFEVDLDNAAGMTTLFSVNNASATAVMAHVTVWSDLGIPVFAYNVYLTGYDIQTINVRDMFNGTVPKTSSDGQDFNDTISPQGLFSQDINFASCSGILSTPNNDLSKVPELYTTYLRAALTGQASTFHAAQCVARNLGTPTIARGYITVDTTNSCTLALPSDPIYPVFLTFQNVLWGDYTYVNPSQDLAYGDALVGVRADQADPETSVPGQYTFYGRFNNWTAADRRTPLATNFVTRYVGAKDFKTVEKARRRPFLPAATELVVWRDPKAPAAGFTCGSAPAWFPLNQEQIRAFDEQEHIETPTFATPPFPAATQKVTVANASFPLTAGSGFLYLNLNTTVAPAGMNPPEDPAAAQAWVSVLQRVQQGPNGGRYDVGYRAIRLDSAQQASHTLIP
jgi:hypothetical protein